MYDSWPKKKWCYKHPQLRHTTCILEIKWEHTGGWGSLCTHPLALDQQIHSLLPTGRFRAVAKAFDLESLLQHMALLSNQSANLYRKLQRLWKGDGGFLPLISFPARVLVLSEHLAFWWNLQTLWGFLHCIQSIIGRSEIVSITEIDRRFLARAEPQCLMAWVWLCLPIQWH